MITALWIAVFLILVVIATYGPKITGTPFGTVVAWSFWVLLNTAVYQTLALDSTYRFFHSTLWPSLGLGPNAR